VLSWGLVTFQDTRESLFFKRLLSAYLAYVHKPPVTSEYLNPDESVLGDNVLRIQTRRDAASVHRTK